MEEWRPVKDFEGVYEVSNFGRVRSLPRVIIRKNGKPFTRKGQIMTLTPTYQNRYMDKFHYFIVCLNWGEKNIRNKLMSVHRLVAEAFVPNPQNLSSVNHINSDRRDNHAVNLEWVTHQENINHYKGRGVSI